MAKLICKLCNKEFRSLILNRELAAQNCMQELTKHVHANHKQDLGRVQILMQQAMQLAPAVIFTDQFVEIGEDPHGDWIAEQFGAQSTQLAMACGFEWEGEEEEGEGEGEGDDTGAEDETDITIPTENPPPN